MNEQLKRTLDALSAVPVEQLERVFVSEKRPDGSTRMVHAIAGLNILREERREEAKRRKEVSYVNM